MGRAIVRKPVVFLFDEPLSNLDAKLRGQMRAELSKLHDHLKTTMIYVTHDQVEAMTMGTQIVVMKDGEFFQVAPPMEIYQYPVNRFVGGFIGSPSMNFLPNTRIITQDGGLIPDADTFQLPIPKNKEPFLQDDRINQDIILGIRPTTVSRLKNDKHRTAVPGPSSHRVPS